MTTRKRTRQTDVLEMCKKSKHDCQKQKEQEIKEAVRRDRERDMTHFRWPSHQQWADEVAEHVRSFLADFPFEPEDTTHDFSKGAWRTVADVLDVSVKDEYICAVGWRYPISDRGCRGFGRLQHDGARMFVTMGEDGKDSDTPLDKWSDVIGKRSKTFIGQFFVWRENAMTSV